VTIPVSGHSPLNILRRDKSPTGRCKPQLRLLIEDRLAAVRCRRAASPSASSRTAGTSLLPLPFSVPISNNRHFYTGHRRFRRWPPFIGAAKRVSRATRGGIGRSSPQMQLNRGWADLRVVRERPPVSISTLRRWKGRWGRN
jgi:hypothetical protein